MIGGKIGTLKGMLALVGAAFTVASFGILVHVVSPMFGTGMQSFLRAFIAAVLIAIVIALRRRLAKLTRGQLIRTIFVGLGAFATFTLFTVSVHTVKIGTAMGVLYGCSIISACLTGAIFLKEKFTAVQLAGTVLALAGLGMYAGGAGLGGISIGIIAGACAGVSDGIANCIRKTLKGVDRNTVVMYQSIVNAFGALAVVFATNERYVVHASLAASAGIVCLGLLSLGLGSMLLYGFSHFEVHVGAVILSSQVFFAVLLGAVFLRELPTPHELIGCTLVCAGGALTALQGSKVLAWFSRKKVVYEDA